MTSRVIVFKNNDRGLPQIIQYDGITYSVEILEHLRSKKVRRGKGPNRQFSHWRRYYKVKLSSDSHGTFECLMFERLDNSLWYVSL